MGNLVILVLAFIVVHYACLSFGAVQSTTPISLCSQTPYRELCHSLGGTKPLGSLGKTQFDIRLSAIKFTLNKAQLAHSLTKAMDVSSFDEPAKLAWTDCLELYDDTVSQLNSSLSSKDPISVQTWLSAAMTNQQTCRNGFIDFNLSHHLESFPVILGDLSKLLSNSLAINKVANLSMATKKTHSRRLLSDGFPKWVSRTDRKLLQLPRDAVQADIVVAQDGSGNYKTISEAVAAAVSKNRFVIHVKAGVYKENVVIKKTLKNLMLIGDGIDATIVTGNKNAQDGSTTFRSATVGISGSGFIARDMTFVNTAGPQKHQAVALRSGSDLSVFYSCSFNGYQDTLYLYAQRQFYRNCHIYGTIDFIFGNAAAVLQNCNIYVRKPIQKITTVTAQARTDPNQNTGFIFHNSIVTAASDMKPVQGSYENYLGRPWQKYSRTVFMKCALDGLINPAGWLPWSGSFGLSTLYYGEYMNTGAGASTGGRVKWPGYHVITSAVEAGKFTVRSFLAGDKWIQEAGVPFTSGL